MTEFGLPIEVLNEVMGFELSDEQVAIATAPLEPNVIIAGAGTGKTTVMAARVVWLIGNGFVQADEVLGLTFTRKAAGELGERITKYLRALGIRTGLGESNAADVRVSTYDSFAGQLVEEFGARIGVNAAARLITSVQRHQLAADVVTGYPGSLEWLAEYAPSSVTGQVLGLESDLQSHLCSIERLESFQSREISNLTALPKPCAAAQLMLKSLYERSELIELVKLYRQRKTEAGLMEFSDQMALAAKIAAAVPQAGSILRQRFKVVLLDEYQDTSAAQAFLLQRLFSGSLGAGRGHPITAVGDPFQAIYGWRGAAAANIEQFELGFPKQDGSRAESYPLTVNRRSGTRILDVSNQVSASLRTGSKDERSGKLVAPSEADEGSLQAGVFLSSDDEIDWLVEEAIASHSTGRASSWKQIGVLVRRNGDVPAIFTALSDRDVPVEIVGLGGLLYLPEIADVVHTIRLCLNPAANYSTSALLSSPRWGISPTILSALDHYARGTAEVSRKRSKDLSEQLANSYASVDAVDNPSLLEAIQRLVKLSPDRLNDGPFDSATLATLKEFAAEITVLGKQVGLSPIDFCYSVIDRQRLFEELAADPTSRGARVNQVHHFLKLAQEFIDLTGSASLQSFLAYLDAAMEVEGGLELLNPSEDDSVKIMTVHKAKGLEMEVVFLPHLIDGVFPGDKLTDSWVRNRAVLPAPLRGDVASIPQLTGYEKFHFDEYTDALKREGRLSEDRLGYVAFTRAKRVLNGTAHVWRPGLVNPKYPSDYLKVLLEAVSEAELLGLVTGIKGDRNPVQDLPKPRPWPSMLDAERATLLAEAVETIKLAQRIRQDATGVGDNELFTQGASSSGSFQELTQMGESGEHPSDGFHNGSGGSYEVGVGGDANSCQDRRLSSDAGLPDTLFSDAASLGLSGEEAELVTNWRDQAELLIAEELSKRSRTVFIPPSSLSTSALISATRHPNRFMEDLIRPMPRPVSGSALLGTRFHEWVENKFALARFTEPLLDELGLEGVIETDEDLGRLIEQFEAGPYAELIPEAVEVPFILGLGERQVRGRIDAVYRMPDGESYQVVDWKTGLAKPDPLQLACYRLAWAKAKGISIDQVDAVFYQLASGEIIRPEALLDEQALLEAIERLPDTFAH